EMNKVLKNINGTAYPSTAAPSSGVYLPYTVVGGKPTFTGGGILVEGNASITLKPTGSTGQTYTIVNGSPSVTTTITIDPAGNGGLGTTTVSNGSTNLTINGVPQQFDPSTGADLGYETMLYVDGSITALKGPGQGQGAIQDGTALTITAAN